MPRIAKTEREKQMDAVARRIRHFYDDTRRERNIDCHTAAKSLGFYYDALNRRLKKPSLFTLGELMTCANTMNISLVTLISGKEDI